MTCMGFSGFASNSLMTQFSTGCIEKFPTLNRSTHPGTFD